MRRVTRALLLLCCVFFDTAVLARINLWGIAPSLVFALVCAYTLTDSPQLGLLCAAAGGLMVDLLCNTAIGLTPALYMLALLALAALAKRRFFKPFFLFLTVSALFFAMQALLAAGHSLLGQVRPYGRVLLLVQAPSALLTGGVSAWFYKVIKKRNEKKQTYEN
ncbi:MAG: rod shape-determining protein MreD [Clostridiales bacterium]|nr:rod shape-determining protein MreD [Clostridiales bacterium]